MLASKKKTTAYTRAFGGGTDNLWETVDTIMVDLMTQQVNGDGIGSEDVDMEKRNANSKKDAELNELMENLDHVLDDLRDISTISSDGTTPPRLIQTSAERLRPRRATNKEFLEKENPFDPITQGLLYQTADIPLFASSDQLANANNNNTDGIEDDVYSEGSEAFDAEWDEDEFDTNSKLKDSSDEVSNCMYYSPICIATPSNTNTNTFFLKIFLHLFFSSPSYIVHSFSN